MAASQGKTPQPDCRTASPALFCEGKRLFHAAGSRLFRHAGCPHTGYSPASGRVTVFSPSHIPISNHSGASGKHRSPRRFPPMPPVSAETLLLRSPLPEKPPSPEKETTFRRYVCRKSPSAASRGTAWRLLRGRRRNQTAGPRRLPSSVRENAFFMPPVPGFSGTPAAPIPDIHQPPAGNGLPLSHIPAPGHAQGSRMHRSPGTFRPCRR